MNKKAIYVGTVLVFVFICSLGAQQNQLPVLKGQYLGQNPPGKKAEIFAGDIITYEVHCSPTFSPDGKEMIIDAMGEDHKYYKMINNTWTQESDLPFKIPGVCNGIFLSPSGERAYFFIWNDRNRFYTSRKKPLGWSELQIMGDDINSFRSSWQFTPAENENLYFSCDGNLMVSVFDGSKHLKPVNLKLEDNNNVKGVTPYIAPDESYLIYSLGYEDDEADLHISYRLKNNKWTKPIDLGPDINIKGNMDLCPMVSPDGKYMFFISRRPGPDYGLYWVDAGFIEDLRPKGMQ